MKRFFFWFFIFLGLFSLFFISLNLFDSRPDSGLAEPIITKTHLESGNGFFLIWGFAEPPETDLLGLDFRKQALELFSARPGNYLFRTRYGQWLTRLNISFHQNWQRPNLYFPRLEEEVCAYFAERRAQIMEQRQRYDVPLRRYRQVLLAVDLEDFTPLGWEFPNRSFLLATFTAKLFAASRALAAIDGDWQKAGDDLLAALTAGLKLIKTGRSLKINSLGKIMVELSLRTLGSILNRNDCPADVIRSILERLPSRPIKEFGTATARNFVLMSFAHALERVKKDKIVDPFLLKDYFHDPADFFAMERLVAMSGPRFFLTVHALAAFFLKENETASMLRAFWDSVGILEETPPWQWDSEPMQQRLLPDSTVGPFWWLRNPMGKMMVRSSVPHLWPVLRNYVYRSLEMKIRYDLLRLLICIRLEKNSINARESAPILALLAAAEHDPYSGQPYRYNPSLNVIYSIGPDREDNGGREKPLSTSASDIAVAVNFVISD